MKRLLGIVFSIVALGALSAAVAAQAGGPARHGDGARSFTVIEHATTDATTDTGAQGDSAGDVLTFANEVFDRTDTRRVGADQGDCIRVVPATSYECTWTTFLPGGQIVAHRDVLAGQAVPEAEDMAVPHRELASGRREGGRPAIRRKYNKRGGLPAPHPHVRDRAVACGSHLDQLESQLGERAVQPRTGGHEPRHAGLGAGGRLVGRHVVHVGGMDGRGGERGVVVLQRCEQGRHDFFGAHGTLLR